MNTVSVEHPKCWSFLCRPHKTHTQKERTSIKRQCSHGSFRESLFFLAGPTTNRGLTATSNAHQQWITVTIVFKERHGERERERERERESESKCYWQAAGSF